MYRRNWCLTVNQCWWDSLETDPKLLLATFLFFVSQTLIAGPFWALTGLGSIFIDFVLNSYRNLVRPYKALLCSVSVAFLILLAAFRYLSIPFVQPNNKNSWFLQVWFGRFFSGIERSFLRALLKALKVSLFDVLVVSRLPLIGAAPF